jgi:kynureninase
VQALTPDRLRAISRRQIHLLKGAVEALDLPAAIAHIETVSDDRRAGFLAVRTSRAASIAGALRGRDVFVDARGNLLRLGPAPYVTDEQLERAVGMVGEELGK